MPPLVGRLVMVVGMVVFPIPVSSNFDSHGKDLVDFELAYNPYLRKYFGCPLEGEVSPTTCRASHQQRDYSLYLRSRKLAMKVFDLRETE
jgi:hypothetical protein